MFCTYQKKHFLKPCLQKLSFRKGDRFNTLPSSLENVQHVCGFVVFRWVCNVYTLHGIVVILSGFLQGVLHACWTALFVHDGWLANR